MIRKQIDLKLERAIYDKSYLYFIVFFLLMIAAFWLSYFSKVFNQENYSMHLHGVPLVTAVTDRIIDKYFARLISYCVRIEGQPIEAVIGFIMVDLFLVGLCIWDWRSHKRWNVFPFALLVLLIYHYSVLNFYKFQFW